MGRPGNNVGRWSAHLRCLHSCRLVHRQIRSCRLSLASHRSHLRRYLHVHVGSDLQPLHGPEGRKRPGTLRKAAVQEINHYPCSAKFMLCV